MTKQYLLSRFRLMSVITLKEHSNKPQFFNQSYEFSITQHSKL